MQSILASLVCVHGVKWSGSFFPLDSFGAIEYTHMLHKFQQIEQQLIWHAYTLWTDTDCLCLWSCCASCKFVLLNNEVCHKMQHSLTQVPPPLL